MDKEYFSPSYGPGSLKKIKAATQSFLGRQPSEIDAGIRETLIKINKLPCVVQTIESCSAHFRYATGLPKRIEAAVKTYFSWVHSYFTQWNWNAKKFEEYLQADYVLTFIDLVEENIYDSELNEYIADDNFEDFLRSKSFLSAIRENREEGFKNEKYRGEVERLTSLIKNEDNAFTDLVATLSAEAFLMISFINSHPMTPVFHRFLVKACQQHGGHYDFPHLEDLEGFIFEAIGDPEAKCSCGCGRLLDECDVPCGKHTTMAYNDCPCPKQTVAVKNFQEYARIAMQQTEIRYFIPIENLNAAKSFWRKIDKFVSGLLR